MGFEYKFNPLSGNLDMVQDLTETIAHADLSDMPDTGGTVSDHDARYYTETEIDLSLAGKLDDAADEIKDTHIDWGTGAGQVSLDDVPDGTSYERVAAAELSSGIYKDATTAVKGISSFNSTNFSVASGAVNTIQDITTASTPQFARLGLGIVADAEDVLAFGAGARITNAGALTFTLDTDISSGDAYGFSANTDIEMTASSGVQSFISITPKISQSNTAGYKAIYVDITETATGSGSKRLLDFGIGGSSKFIVSYSGTSGIAICIGTASYMQAGEMRATADVGGAASQVSMTNATLGAAGGAVTINRNTAGTTTNAGWVKFYVGTTAYGMPMVLWTNL